jgi:hypothetical protein
MFGLMTVGVHRRQAVKTMMQGLDFLQNQAGQIPEHVNLDKGVDSLQICDVFATVRGINRAMETQHRKIAGGPVEDQNTSVVHEVI